MAFSPDGTILATGTNQGPVILRSVKTGNVIDVLQGQTNRIHALAFSTDGTLLASGGNDESARIWSLPTRAMSVSQNAHGAGAVRLSLCADGGCMATVGQDQKIRVRDPRTGLLRTTIDLARLPGEYVTALAPDGSTLAIAGEDKIARFWDLATGQETARLHPATDSVTSISFAPDGKAVAVGTNAGNAAVWDYPFAAPLNGNTTVSEFLLAKHSDTRAPRFRFDLPGNRVWSIVFAPDSRTLAMALQKGGVAICDMATGKRTQTLKGVPGFMRVAYSPDGSKVAAGAWSGEVYVWDLKDAGPPLVFRGHSAPVMAIAFTRNGRTVTSAGNDRSVRFWDLAGKEERCTFFDAHDNSVVDLVFTPDGRLMITSSRDGTFKFWPADLERAEALRAWRLRRIDECECNGELDIAVAHFDQLIENEPEEFTHRVRRAHWLADLNRWPRAVAEFELIVAHSPNVPWSRNRLAVAYLASGRLGDYRRSCAELLERWGSTTDRGHAQALVECVVVAPENISDWSRLIPVAERAAKRIPGNERLLGAVLARARKPDEALKLLDKLKAGVTWRAWDMLFQAMAHHQLGNGDEARRLLANAQSWIDEADRQRAKGLNRNKDSDWGDVYERVEVHHLLREVISLIHDNR